jgi:hypothetical protein
MNKIRIDRLVVVQRLCLCKNNHTRGITILRSIINICHSMDLGRRSIRLHELRAHKRRMAQLATVFALHNCNLTGHRHLGRFGALGRVVLGIFLQKVS